METGVFHRLHSTTFLHRPWPATFSLWLFPLSSNLPRLCAKFPGGTRNSGAAIVISRSFSGSVDGEWRRSAKKRRRGRWFDDGPVEPDEMAPRFWEEFVDSMWFLKVRSQRKAGVGLLRLDVAFDYPVRASITSEAFLHGLHNPTRPLRAYLCVQETNRMDTNQQKVQT